MLCCLQGVVLPGQVPADGSQSTTSRQLRRKRPKVQLNATVFYQPGVPRTKHSGVTASLRAPVGAGKLRPSSVTSESGVEMTPFEQRSPAEVSLPVFPYFGIKLHTLISLLSCGCLTYFNTAELSTHFCIIVFLVGSALGHWGFCCFFTIALWIIAVWFVNNGLLGLKALKGPLFS